MLVKLLHYNDNFAIYNQRRYSDRMHSYFSCGSHWPMLAHGVPAFGQLEIEALACLYMPDPMQCKCGNIKLD